MCYNGYIEEDIGVMNMTRTVELTVAQQIEWLENNTKGIDKVLANFVEVSGCIRGWDGTAESKLVARFDCYNRRYATCENSEQEYTCQDIDFECISVTVTYKMQAGSANELGISPIVRVNSRTTKESILVNIPVLLTELNKWSRVL